MTTIPLDSLNSTEAEPPAVAFSSETYRGQVAGNARSAGHEKHIAAQLVRHRSQRIAPDAEPSRAEERHDNSRIHPPSPCHAWSLMREIVEPPSESSELLYRYLLGSLARLVHTWTASRPTERSYIDRLLAYSMMPIYLRVDAIDPTAAIEEATTLAHQANLLCDLHYALERELFELLVSKPFLELIPEQALIRALDVSLHRIAEASPIPIESCRRGVDIEAAILEGYWTIAHQWQHGKGMIRIPPQMQVGIISWPRVQEHWQQLIAVLQQNATAPRQPFESSLVNDLAAIEACPIAPPSHSRLDLAPPKVHDFIEIRCANDPKLAEALDVHLEQCRDQGGTMSLIVVRGTGERSSEASPAAANARDDWQGPLIEILQEATNRRLSRGFVTDHGEIALIVDELDRTEIVSLVRDAMEQASRPLRPAARLIDAAKLAWYCGISSVSSPTKRFRIEQLIQAAWRCLDAANQQGTGGIKSIEVF